ncbi:MAG: hypothetical protein K0S32_4561 [Bacteroidetes bacterium]|jgi:hypothetical protein|nr:hypothetical protein [Bacteroidota bacterium]
MKEQTIKNIVDFHLEKWVAKGINMLPGKIESEMADPNQNEDKEWKTWFPINSKVTDLEIEEFENQIAHKLPHDYKIFLKYKHFYDLNISEVSFFRFPVNTWNLKFIDRIFNGEPREYLIDKGYLPFADWSDWGLLCFDTNRNNGDNNYPIVLWDHEIADEVSDEYLDFYNMLIQIDEVDRSNNS